MYVYISLKLFFILLYSCYFSVDCSEEIFDFSAGEMTSAKIKHMKTSLGGEFSLIFQLCQFVLSESQNPTLLVATLEVNYKSRLLPSATNVVCNEWGSVHWNIS